ncbi:MAG: T9SS type A sorting domain-containing protein [Bacteroidetes bacterium]|nr:T9SS type A sorting domain-containing protein [Bacteroidota bacterium]
MRTLFASLFALVLLSSISVAQQKIDAFDYARPDTVLTHAVEGDKSYQTFTQNTSDKVEGESSLEVRTAIGAYHQWGSYSTFGFKNPGNYTEDWSLSDSISIRIKVKMAPKHPEYMVFRIQIADQPNPDDPVEEYIYENATVIDAATEWIELRVPFIERNQPGADVPDETGFILAPTSWGGFNYNDKVLNRDKIYQWTIGIVTSGYDAVNNLPADSVDILFDDFIRFGTRSVPVIIFNGRDFSGIVNGAAWTWGQSSVSVENDAGPLPKTNAIKWVQGDEWGNGWTGWGVNLFPTNMVGAWTKDSIKFTMKCDTGVGDLRVQLEGGGGKRGTTFTPFADNEWHNYAFKLREMYGPDGTETIDSSAINVFGIMAEASAKAGKVIYITNIWSGDPVFDIIPPDPPSGISAISSQQYTNLILWTDVANEPKARYNVYYKDQQWTSLEDSTLNDIPLFNLPTGTQLQTHLLRSPLTDKSVTYYYGVVAKDEAGNLSEPAFSAPVTNTAKGVPTISLQPLTFSADGDLGEWANVTPFVLSKNGECHVNENGAIADDADLSGKLYLAADNEYLYVAYDITDEKVVVDTTVNSYENDSPDLYIGLYNWVGRFHSGIKSGATPDYHIRFAMNKIILDNNGSTIMYPGANYYWQEKAADPGYIVEAKIPYSALAAALGGVTTTFVPVNGYRIPIDIVINDRDDRTTSDLRDGMLIYSPTNTADASWQDMWRWTYTWIGTGIMGVGNTSSTINTYTLEQNYPNPFNPATQIHFSLAKSGLTTLKVYDILGRLVTTLVDGYQEAGPHTVSFNSTRNLSSGIYIYRIESGSFRATKKMMLLK